MILVKTLFDRVETEYSLDGIAFLSLFYFYVIYIGLVRLLLLYTRLASNFERKSYFAIREQQ